MPNNFSLIRKSAPEAGPVRLAEIDEELCRLLDMPVHPQEWVCYWYDLLGFPMACGVSLSAIAGKQEFWVNSGHPEVDDFDRRLLRIAEHLRDNYTVDAWATVGR